MFILLSVLATCITVLFVIHSLQNKPITFIIHRKYEEIRQDKPLSDEEKQILEDQKDISDGMNEVIRFTQEFLGGDVDNADTKQQTE